MRYLLLALCIGLPLSACQDTTGAKGPPPTFSPGVQAYFEEYMSLANPLIFVVSTDGRAVSYRYCPAHADRCLPITGGPKSELLRNCETDSGGVPCKVYAIKRRIVWKGTPVPSSQTPKATQTPDDATASGVQDGREKIYNQLMVQMLNYIEPKTGQKFAYRSLEKNKTLAVCIDWNRSKPNDIWYSGSSQWSRASSRSSRRPSPCFSRCVSVCALISSP